MKTCFLVFRHELIKLFSDKRDIFSMFFLPVVSVLLIGFITMPEETEASSRMPRVYVLHAPENCPEVNELGELVLSDAIDREELLEREEVRQEDVILEYTGEGCNIYYDGTNETSIRLQRFCYEQLHQQMLEIFAAAQEMDCSDRIVLYDKNKSGSTENVFAALVIPYMLILTLFQETSAFAIDVISREKERGVFDKTMLAPISSASVLLGKAMSGVVCGMLSCGIYLLVILVAAHIPNGSSFKLYNLRLTPKLMLLLFLCAVCLSVLFALVSVLCSLLAGSVSEAKSMRLPVYGGIIVLSLAAMIFTGSKTVFHYLLPVYNICILMQEILNNTVEISSMLYVLTSLVFCGVVLLNLMLRFCYRLRNGE